MTEREFNLSERAEALGLELRRDDDGCYWLDSFYDPSFRSAGPFDIDEVEDHLEAAECGMNKADREAFCADRRWRRLHPELFENEE